jgi:hypothetical protein
MLGRPGPAAVGPAAAAGRGHIPVSAATERGASRAAVRRDNYGVAAWFALGPGIHESPFSNLKAQLPRMWRRFVRAATANQYGA